MEPKIQSTSWNPEIEKSVLARWEENDTFHFAVDRSRPAFVIDTPPPYPITRGQVLAVLPFQNVVATLQINGAELKQYLENSVFSMPGANGRFAQVSGLCFTYDISAPAGSRVTSVVRQAADGSCTGPPVDLTAGSSIPGDGLLLEAKDLFVDEAALTGESYPV